MVVFPMTSGGGEMVSQSAYHLQLSNKSVQISLLFKWGNWRKGIRLRLARRQARCSCCLTPAVPAGSHSLATAHCAVGTHSTDYHVVTLNRMKLKNQTSNFVRPPVKISALAALLAGQLTGTHRLRMCWLTFLALPRCYAPIQQHTANHKTGFERRCTLANLDQGA